MGNRFLTPFPAPVVGASDRPVVQRWRTGGSLGQVAPFPFLSPGREIGPKGVEFDVVKSDDKVVLILDWE